MVMVELYFVLFAYIVLTIVDSYGIIIIGRESKKVTRRLNS